MQRWTATTNGPYSDEPYYLRLTKDRRPDRGTRYSIGDGGPSRADQRRVVDPSFLELVRLGVKRHDDPVILNTLEVVDQRLQTETPNGPFWHRFTYDGYGETREGGGWRLTKENSRLTFGRLWPIFAGERGEYELLAGRPADTYLKSIADAGNDGGMIPEQVWDGQAPDQPAGGRGNPLGDPARVVARAARAARLVDRRGHPGRAALDRGLPLRTDVSLAALSSVADLAPERGFSLPGAS